MTLLSICLPKLYFYNSTFLEKWQHGLLPDDKARWPNPNYQFTISCIESHIQSVYVYVFFSSVWFYLQIFIHLFMYLFCKK